MTAADRRGGRRVAAVLVGLIGLGLLLAPAASAHATLVSSDPADGSVLSRPPQKVTLRYSEGVRVTLGSIRVLDAAGDRVDRGNARVGPGSHEATVGVRSGIARGTYVVAWSVVSADGHPVHGGFTFSVGEPSKVGDRVLASALADRSSGAWGAAGDVARFFHLAGALLTVGGACYLVLVDPARSRDLSPWLAVGAVVAVVGALAEVPVLAAEAAGLGLRSVTEPGVASQVLGDGVGLSIALLAAAVGAAAVAPRATTSWLRWALIAAAVVLLTTSSTLTGHARTTEPSWLVLPAEALHVAAAAIWTGGLTLLVVGLRHRRSEAVEHASEPPEDRDERARKAATVVARFSSVATVSVVAVLVAGGALAWAQVRTLSALDTQYGWLLVAKVAVVVAVAAVGAYNHYRLVPAVERAGAGRPGGGPWSMLRRALRLEALGMVAIVGITAVLVATQPARVAAGSSGPVSATAAFGPGTVNVVVDPAHAGRNSIHAYVLDATGRPVDRATSFDVQLTLPARDIGPLDAEATKAGPGHYQVLGATFPFDGEWQVTVEAKVDEFTAWRATVPVRISS